MFIRRYQSNDVTQEFFPLAVLPCCAVLVNFGALSSSLIFNPVAFSIFFCFAEDVLGEQ